MVILNSHHLMAAEAERKLSRNNNIEGSAENYDGQYKKIFEILDPLIIRSYEAPLQAYYIVFSPYKATYNQNLDYYETKKFVDGVEKYIKSKYNPQIYVITRETIASLIHINVYMITKKLCDNSTLKKGSVNHKFGISIYEKDLTISTRYEILKYIFKEAKERQFLRFIDWVHKDFLSASSTKCEAVAHLHPVTQLEEEEEKIDNSDLLLLRSRMFAPL